MEATKTKPESKIDATHRLKREGRWDEASVFRDEVREKHKADGKTRREAGKLAWEEMISQFPPLPESEQPDDPGIEDSDLDIESLLERFEGTEHNLKRDAIWVYSNLANAKAGAADAPSLGAWSMLAWARGNPARFFEHVLPKQIKDRVDAEAEAERKDRKTIAEINEMLEQILAEDPLEEHLIVCPECEAEFDDRKAERPGHG